MDDRTESVGRKIRDAELQKVPYMLVVGDKEEENRQVSVRRHREGDLGAMPVAQLAERADRRDRAPGIGPTLYSPRMKGTKFSRTGNR